MNVVFEQRSAKLYEVLCLVEEVVISFEIMKVNSANDLIQNSDFIRQTLKIPNPFLLLTFLHTRMVHQVFLKLDKDFAHLLFIYTFSLLHVSEIAH